MWESTAATIYEGESSVNAVFSLSLATSVQVSLSMNLCDVHTNNLSIIVHLGDCFVNLVQPADVHNTV